MKPPSVGGKDQFHCHKDLYDAIEKGDFPSWTLNVQVMPEADAPKYRIDPFDLTKVWNHKDYPLIPIAKLVLNRTPDNFFAETEHAAFDPGHMVPGIGPSPDRMLQARLFGTATRTAIASASTTRCCRSTARRACPAERRTTAATVRCRSMRRTVA